MLSTPGKRLREEEADPVAEDADKVGSNGVQARHYRGQRVETPSYPGAAPHPSPISPYSLLKLCTSNSFEAPCIVQLCFNAALSCRRRECESQG